MTNEPQWSQYSKQSYNLFYITYYLKKLIFILCHRNINDTKTYN